MGYSSLPEQENAPLMRPSLRLVVLLLIFLPPRFASAAPQVAYTVAMPRPWTHLLDVEMRLTHLSSRSKTVELALPVWTPGSYLVREYARNVQDFAESDSETLDGAALKWQKTRKNVWRIEKGGASSVIVHYRVYANLLTVQQAEVTDAHAFWNNAAVLMHLADRRDVPVTLTIVPPSGWKVATGLTPVAGSPNTFAAPDWDTLYDCPVEVSDFVELAFTVRNLPHRIIIDGAGNYDPERLKKDVAKIVEAQAAMMGGLPYDNYTFLLHLRNGIGGGLEHKNSTALGYLPNGFKPDATYPNFLTLVSHEYFHLWNVKRIKPDALGPFDYNNENYTRLLWVAEGITSYYENLHLRRADLITPEDFLKSAVQDIASVERTPGRKMMSLEEASFDAWIKYYRPDENAVNSQVSYYSKGAVVGMLLDLTIRQKSNGAKSLDDVMRSLWTDYALKNKNYTPEDFQRLCESHAGSGLDPFFAKYVRGRDELDYDAAFAAVGLRLQRAAEDKEGKSLPPEPYFGAALTPDPAGVKVTAIPSDAPVYEQSLMTGDVIILVDNQRISSSDAFNERIREKRPGDAITLTLFRFDALKTLTIRLGGRLRPDFRLLPLKEATDAQKVIYKQWLAADFPKS